MAVPRVALIARFTLPAALDAMRDAALWLEAHGCQPLIESASARAAEIDRWPVVVREELGTSADVIVAFGGDGTLLDAASAVAHGGGEAPLIGVNLGRLGFLTEIGRSDLVPALQAILDGKTTIETRLMLAGTVLREQATAGARLALNDIVVTRNALSRMIELDVEVDGKFISHVKADGLIIATATGSTAYNLSAGGPIVHPSVDAMVLTPIAPHALTNRPLVLPATAHLRLRPHIDAQSDIVVTFDGQFGLPLSADDVVDVQRASRVLRLLRISTRTHFDMLRDKLKWGNT
jgi:NAD+ kinase